MSEKKQQSSSTKGVDKSRDALLSGGRKRGSPAHAFMSTSSNQSTKTEKDNENISENHTNEHTLETETGKNNKETEQYSGISNSVSEQDKENKASNINRNSETNTENNDGNSKEVTDTRNTDIALDDGQDSFWDLIEEEKKKKTVEETHTRQTYLIRNDLLKELNKVSRKQGKGFKTKVINYALEQFLNDINNDHRK